MYGLEAHLLKELQKTAFGENNMSFNKRLRIIKNHVETLGE
jgi:hypothetical protein